MSTVVFLVFSDSHNSKSLLLFIMDRKSRELILGLPFSDKELKTRNRRLNGYSVYVYWFYSDLKQMSTCDLEELLIEKDICSEEYFAVDLEFADVMSKPEITQIHKSKLCGKYWRSLTNNTRRAWKERAELVNGLPKTLT